MRLRFAPSPTGQLHVGNARTALFNWLLARGSGGTFILRIEDTDIERSTRESEAAILSDLRWLGLGWDEGPDRGGPMGPYRQSERLHLYGSYAKELVSAGKAYYCFCSPEELEADRQAALLAGEVPRYSGRCKQISPGEALLRLEEGASAVVRFSVPSDHEVVFQDVVRGQVHFHTDVIGDPILLRSDGSPAYNFAVVVDDALMEISHVIRGEDHISNTPRQVLFYDALGVKRPIFAHLSLVMGPDHSPLSKRHGATSVAEFRSRGYLPESLVNYLALLGWSPGGGDEVLPVEEMARRFSLEAVGQSAAVFDEEKLAWVNRHYLRHSDPERVTALAIPYFERAGFMLNPDEAGRDFARSIMEMAVGAVDRLDQVPNRLRFLWEFDARLAVTRPDVAEILGEPGAVDVIEALARELSTAPRLTREGFRAVAERVRQTAGRKGRALFHPIRAALTGRTGGPELDMAVPAIDRGAELPESSGVRRIVGCRERAAAFVAAVPKPGGRGC
jgi:nondiscriminating glutamyl-tRNA synthetase